MYARNSIKKYLDDLAAKSPAPGGGSAAALEAAMGCALMSMALAFTIANKRYIDFKDKADQAKGQTERLRVMLMKLIDEDVRAYNNLSKGIKKFKKDSPQLERAYKEACGVVYEICKNAFEGLKICRDIVEYANRNLITDTATASLMLESSFLGAKFNVYINLKYINDREYIENVHKDLSALEEAAPKLKEEILHKAEEVIIT